jgi:hypothetical protein
VYAVEQPMEQRIPLAIEQLVHSFDDLFQEPTGLPPKHYKDLGLLQQKCLSQYMPNCSNTYQLPQNDIRWQPLQLDPW